MVHQYKLNGYNIVMDIDSGSIHVVDDISYDLIALYNDHSKSQIADQLLEKYPAVKRDEIFEAYDEIQGLVDEGTLFTHDIYKDKIEDFAKRPNVVKALCLHIAHDCNLSCKYCFAEEGMYHGKKAELMSFEVGKQALDFLIANSGNRTNLEVDFFGGEPTMNWQVVKDLVAYGRSQEEEHNKKFRFTLTTNGLLLNDEIMEFCNKEMGNVVLSIDGRKEVNDMMRPTRNGKSAYDIILPKFKKFAESRNQDKYYVRGTFTHYNLDFAKDVLALADEGFKQISVEPVVAPADADYAIRKEDLPILFKEYEDLAAEMVKRHNTDKEFNFFHFMIDLEGGPCVYKRLSGCGSGTEYLAVTPGGELYPCHQFVGNTEFLMGNVWDGVKNEKLRDEFKCCNVYAKKACRDCFARFYCSGGCQANAYNFTGDVKGQYEIGCELQRKRIECAIMIKAAEADM
ncbi:MAG: thioether cross-link-forming SCIFF peptide maturase [Lachnospiraceae bacterium]|nr:thioether cross-link-forming SCIFF peptide maturase [Lachnospiraceae bacterium]MDD7701798.1 thioether cross-link-forming SCIFF peptide maturase [Lachnospiraceae bacterium]